MKQDPLIGLEEDEREMARTAGTILATITSAILLPVAGILCWNFWPTIAEWLW